MTRRRWRHRCRAERVSGDPCRAWAISGGTVCTAHGGASPQVRRAAEVRLAELSLRRALDHARTRHAQVRQTWLIARVRWAAGALGRDPAEVAVELARPFGSVFLLVPAGVEWPAGLRDEDEPRLKFDRRYGRRSRVAS